MTEPSASFLRAVRDSAVNLASEVGAYLLEGFRAPVDVRLKGAIDLVTQYDEEAERRLRASLATLAVGLGVSWRIVGEEAGESGSKDAADLVWYVDPIDGTTNYAHGHPFFCISMGLYDSAGTPLVGVVHAPALAVTWASVRGEGATRNGSPVSVSERSTLDEALCATGFPYDRREADDDNLREYRAFLKRARGVRRCGSAALDLALVAEGTYDVYWEQRLAAWDMAAGAALVLEAGGQLSDYDGSVGDPLTGRLVATNGHLHSAAIEVLAED